MSLNAVSSLTGADHNAQVGEALAGVKVINKVLELGMPIRKQAATKVNNQ